MGISRQYADVVKSLGRNVEPNCIRLEKENELNKKAKAEAKAKEKKKKKKIMVRCLQNKEILNKSNYPGGVTLL